MSRAKGVFLTIEGTDGSGKATQTKLLAQRLRNAGRRVRTIAFPRHGHPAAWAVDEYLRGRYGAGDDPSTAHAVSMLYATDRFDASAQIRQWLRENSIVIADRYALSNLAYSAAKVSPSKRRALWKWIQDLEYGTLHIPKADYTIVLAAPSAITHSLIHRRAQREKRAIDQLEKNQRYLRTVGQIYCELAQTLPHTTLIDCAPKGKLLSKEEIHEKIWAVVSRKLEIRNPKSETISKSKNSKSF